MEDALVLDEEHLDIESSDAAKRFFSEEDDNLSDQSVIIDEPLTDDTVIASETCSESTSLSNDTTGSLSGGIPVLRAKSVVSETNSEESRGSHNADLQENYDNGQAKSVIPELEKGDAPIKNVTYEGSGSDNIGNFSDTSSELLPKITEGEVKLGNKAEAHIRDNIKNPVNTESDVVPSSMESVDVVSNICIEDLSVDEDVEEIEIIKESTTDSGLSQLKQVTPPDQVDNSANVELNDSVVISSDEESRGSDIVELVSSDDEVKEVSSGRRDSSEGNMEHRNSRRNTKHKFYRRDDLGKYVKDDDVCTKDLEYSKSLGVDYLDPYESQYDFPAYMNPLRGNTSQSKNNITEEERSISQCPDFSSLSPFSSGGDASPTAPAPRLSGTDATQGEPAHRNVDLPQQRSTKNLQKPGSSPPTVHCKDTDNSISFAKEDMAAGCDPNNPIDLDELCNGEHTTSSTERTANAVSGKYCEGVDDTQVIDDDDEDDKNVDILFEMISEESTKSPEYLLNSSSMENTGGSDMLETLITVINEDGEKLTQMETGNDDTPRSPTSENISSESGVDTVQRTVGDSMPLCSDRISKEHFLDDISASFAGSTIPDVVEDSDVVIGPQGFPAWMQNDHSPNVTCSCDSNSSRTEADNAAPNIQGCPKCFQRQQTSNVQTHQTSYWKNTSNPIDDSFESKVKKKRKKKKRHELAPKSVSMCLDDFMDVVPAKRFCSDETIDSAIVCSSEEPGDKTGETGGTSVTEQCLDGGTMTNGSDSQPEMLPTIREYSCLSEPRELLVSREEFKKQKGNHLRGCLWSPDGCSVLTNSDDNILRLFNIPDDVSDNATAEELHATVRMGEGETVYDMDWYPYMQNEQPDTCCFLTTSRDHPVHLWDSTNGAIRCSYRAFDQMDELTSAHCVSFNLYGDKIYCGYNKCVRVFDSSRPGNQCEERCTVVKKNQSKKRRTVFSDSQSGIISSIAFSESCGMYACGSFAKTVGLYDVNNGNMSCVLRGHNGGVTQVKFTSDGYYLISGARKDSEMLWWDLRNTTVPLFKLLRQVSTNQRIQFDIDRESAYVFSGSTDNTVNIWDLQKLPTEVEDDVISYQPSIRFTAHKDAVNAVCLHPTKPLLASTSGQRHFYQDSDSDTSTGEAVTSGSMGVDNSLKIWLL